VRFPVAHVMPADLWPHRWVECAGQLGDGQQAW
jgi:hypothetical protein